MTNSRASSSPLVKLSDQTTTGTVTAITYAATMLFSKYSKIIVEFELHPTGTLVPHLEVNNVTSGYYVDNYIVPALTEAGEDNSANIHLTESIITDQGLTGRIEIKSINDVSGYLAFNGYSNATNLKVTNMINAQLISDQSHQLTEIEIGVSTSTWKVGSRMTIYGVLA